MPELTWSWSPPLQLRPGKLWFMTQSNRNKWGLCVPPTAAQHRAQLEADSGPGTRASNKDFTTTFEALEESDRWPQQLGGKPEKTCSEKWGKVKNGSRRWFYKCYLLVQSPEDTSYPDLSWCAAAVRGERQLLQGFMKIYKVCVKSCYFCV